MSTNPPSLLKSAAIGGLLFGFLGGAPITGWANCACCALVVLAGFVAAAIHGRDSRAAGVAFDASIGLRVGLLAAVFYAIANTITSTISSMLFHQATIGWFEMLEEMPEVSPELLERIDSNVEQGLVASVLLAFVVNLGLGFVFSSVGGLIGGTVLRHRPEAPIVEPPEVG